MQWLLSTYERGEGIRLAEQAALRVLLILYWEGCPNRVAGKEDRTRAIQPHAV